MLCITKNSAAGATRGALPPFRIARLQSRRSRLLLDFGTGRGNAEDLQKGPQCQALGKN